MNVRNTIEVKQAIKQPKIRIAPLIWVWVVGIMILAPTIFVIFFGIGPSLQRVKTKHVAEKNFSVPKETHRHVRAPFPIPHTAAMPQEGTKTLPREFHNDKNLRKNIEAFVRNTCKNGISQNDVESATVVITPAKDNKIAIIDIRCDRTDLRNNKSGGVSM